MRPLSQTTARILSRNFSRKYIAIGKIVSHWNDIVGSDLANKAQPVKIHYRKYKQGGKTPEASLEIATTSAHATILHYQKDLILERINRIFGENWITAVKFVTVSSNTNFSRKKPPPRALDKREKIYLSEMLDGVQDHDIKDRLERLGQAIIREEER